MIILLVIIFAILSLNPSNKGLILQIKRGGILFLFAFLFLRNFPLITRSAVSSQKIEWFLGNQKNPYLLFDIFEDSRSYIVLKKHHRTAR